MRAHQFETRLKKQIEEVLPGVTPGLVLQVHKAGKKVCDIGVGTFYPYYDLASLTKVIFTTQAFMKAFELGLWNQQSKISDRLDWFPYKEITVLECLNHSSGLIWWHPFYQKIDLNLECSQRWESLKKVISELPLEKKEQSTYSDVNFLVLGFFLENLYQSSLLTIWKKMKDEFFSGTTFDFHPENRSPYKAELYAPTETGLWRNKLIQGEVHDDNTWALGGIAPHAGLFGSIDDVGWYALLIRSQYIGNASQIIKPKTARFFATRSRPLGLGDWGYGFMVKSEHNSLLGDNLSLNTFGHWGFTGTSVWYDPVQDVSICILSNRTLYGREKKDFNLLRPVLHNLVMEGLRRA